MEVNFSVLKYNARFSSFLCYCSGCTGWGLETVRFVTALENQLQKISVVAGIYALLSPTFFVSGLIKLGCLVD